MRNALLDVGADVEVRNAKGVIPLHVAVMRGELSTVRLLIEREADVNAQDDDGESALHGIVTCIIGAKMQQRNLQATTGPPQTEAVRPPQMGVLAAPSNKTHLTSPTKMTVLPPPPRQC